MVVAEPQRRHADEDQLPLEALSRHLAREHRRGRDEPRVVVPREMDPHRAVSLRGNPDVTDFHRAHAAPVTPDAEGRRPRRDAEHLDAESRDQRVADRGDQRDPADDPASRVNAQQGVPRGGAVDVGDAAEGGPEAGDSPRWVLAADDRGCEVALGRPVGGLVQARQPDHAWRGGEGLAERAVAVGHRRHPGRGLLGEARQAGREARPRVAIRLGEQEVQPHGGRLRRADPVDELGQELAGPGPLAIAGKAGLVHGHDDGGPRHADARREPLAGVEPEPAQPGGPPREEEEAEGDQHQSADRPPGAPGPERRAQPRPRRTVGCRARRERCRAGRGAVPGRTRAVPGRARVVPGQTRAVPGRARAVRGRARRQRPRAGDPCPRPSDTELETVVRGRDPEGAFTPGQLLEALGLPPDGRQLLVVVGRLVMEEAQVPDSGHLAQLDTRRCCSSGPSPP